MVIYDDIGKNTKIFVYSKSKNILDHIAKEIGKDGFKTEKYNAVEDIEKDVKRKKIKLLIYIFEKEEEIAKIQEKCPNSKIILYSSKKVNIEAIKLEIVYNIKLIDEETKMDFAKYKLEIVGNLVESISHKIQSNLLVLGASQDIIKLLNDDLSESDEKRKVLENLYTKNDDALQKSNLLLQLISNATNLSYESIMHAEDIKEIIFAILDEYLKEYNIIFKVNEKIKIGSYICGPLNDVIFVTCRVIKLLIDEGKNEINLNIHEDEEYWYFEIETKEKIQDSLFIEKIRKFIVYIKNVSLKVQEKKISLIIKKIK